MFASAATASRPLAIATAATVATETRAVRDFESRTVMPQGMRVSSRPCCAESRSVVSGTDWWRIQVAKAARDKAHPQKYQKGTAADASPRTMGPERSS